MIKKIKKGLTLIETIIGMVIITIAFYILIQVFINLTPRTATIEDLNKKTYLAQEKIEEFLARRFDQMSGEISGNFSGSFSNYNYKIVVTYVATSDLNTAVPGPTPFKNIKAKVWGGPLHPETTIEITSLMATYEIQ